MTACNEPVCWWLIINHCEKLESHWSSCIIKSWLSSLLIIHLKTSHPARLLEYEKYPLGRTSNIHISHRYVFTFLPNFRSLNCAYWSTFYVSPNKVALGGCPFNGPLSAMKYPTRESPRRDAASPIKYNGRRVPQPTSRGHCAQPALPYRNIMDWPAVLLSTAAVA